MKRGEWAPAREPRHGWPRPPGSGRRQGPRLFGPVLIGAVQVIGINLAAADQTPLRDVDAIGYTLLLAGPAALVLCQRWPLPMYGITMVVTVGYLAGGYPAGPFFLAALVALFAAVRRSRRGAVWAVTAAGYLALVLLGGGEARLVVAGYELADPGPGTYVAIAAWTALALALAEANRLRANAFAEMARAQAEADRARREQSRRQASDERLRIARELHDVLGHHLSLINVRAGVALHLLETDRGQAGEALGAIRTASAEALREVRGVLAALEPGDESPPRSPAPGLVEIDRLADDARAAGLRITLAHTGDGAVPGEVGRAAYRIVQEALTNVRRHAGPQASATVTLANSADALTVLIEDTGTGPTPSASVGDGALSAGPAGEGIPGMRERALALGGSLEAGRRPGGGFRVAARLPFAGSALGEVGP